jgi:hypothetical protein
MVRCVDFVQRWQRVFVRPHVLRPFVVHHLESDCVSYHPCIECTFNVQQRGVVLMQRAPSAADDMTLNQSWFVVRRLSRQLDDVQRLHTEVKVFGSVDLPEIATSTLFL